MVMYLIRHLNDSELAASAAQGIDIIMKQHDDYLIKESFVVSKLLFKQKLYHFAVPHLLGFL
jgi:hypothetical protein